MIGFCSEGKVYGYAYVVERIAHAHDVEDEMGMGRETKGRAELRAKLTGMGADGSKMVVKIVEQEEVFDENEYPSITLLAFASAPLV